MESASVILFASALGVTTVLLTILYFLYKCLMRETPYQRTLLIDEVDAKHGSNDKKLAKKYKSSVRHRIVPKPVETGEKVPAREAAPEAEKAAAAPDVGAIDASSATASIAAGSGGKLDAKKKHQPTAEKVVEKVQQLSTAAPKTVAANKKSNDEASSETDAPKPQTSAAPARPLPVARDDKVKGRGASTNTTVEQHLPEKKEDKKVLQQQQLGKQVKEAMPQKQSKEATTGQDRQDASHHELTSQQQTEKKKKGKKSVEAMMEAAVAGEPKGRPEPPVPPVSMSAKVATEEDVIVDQKSKVTLGASLPQQQPQVNKKKSNKPKMSEEIESAIEVPLVQTELRQKKAASLAMGSGEHHLTPSLNNPSRQQQPQQQQQQQLLGNKAAVSSSHADVEGLKRLIGEKDALLQRDQLQLKSLNEALFQLKKELAGERGRIAEMDNSLHAVNKKHNEEKQSLLSSLHQNDQQSKQAIQLLQQELQASKARPGDLSIIMANLAEENAKLKSEISRFEKQLADEIAQRSKTVELLNESLRDFDCSEMRKNSLELKLKQAEERSRSIEIKQNDTSDAMSRLEKVYYDLQQEHQHLKMQNQSSMELQSQLRATKVENDELHTLVEKLRKETTSLQDELQAATSVSAKVDNDKLHALVKSLRLELTSLQDELQASRTAPITIEAAQQSCDDQMANGCSDSGLVAGLEDQLAEQQLRNKDLLLKLDATDDRNKGLESERSELFVALEELKKQVVELETELESVKMIPIPAEPLVVCHKMEGTEQTPNGCSDVDLVKRLEVCLADKEQELNALVEKLGAKEKKNEDLRQKNWKAMEALSESEKRLESLEHERDSQLKGLVNEIESLKVKIVEYEKTTSQIQTASDRRAALDGKSGELSEDDEVKVARRETEDEDPGIENVKEMIMVARANEICIDRQEDEIKKLTLELQEQRSKNDKLREKNWSVMTSLNEAEKKLEYLYSKLESTEREVEDLKAISSANVSPSSPSKSSVDCEEAEVVRKEYMIINKVKETCQWDMSQLVLDLDTKTAELEILQSLLDQHENAITVLKTENDELKKTSSVNKVLPGIHANDSNGLDNEQVSEERRIDLEQKVEHYKKVLSDTEVTLKSLEASVYAEEKKWRSKIDRLEQEVASLKEGRRQE